MTTYIVQYFNYENGGEWHNFQADDESNVELISLQAAKTVCKMLYTVGYCTGSKFPAYYSDYQILDSHGVIHTI